MPVCIHCSQQFKGFGGACPSCCSRTATYTECPLCGAFFQEVVGSTCSDCTGALGKSGEFHELRPEYAVVDSFSFADAQGRICVVKLNANNELGLDINHQPKVHNLRGMTANGDLLSFEGDRFEFGETTLKVIGEADEILVRILALRHDALEDKALALLESGGIRILSADWLLQKPDDYILQRCQDLPLEAFVTPESAAVLFKRTPLDGGSLLALSYPWCTKEHPDPGGFHFRVVQQYLAKHKERLRLRYPDNADDLGLFWDFAALPQKGLSGQRTATEQVIFKRGLEAMAALYGSHNTLVLLQKALPHEPLGVAIPYSRRGWCLFEATVSNILKPASLRLDLEVAREALDTGDSIKFWGASTAKRASLYHPDTMKALLGEAIFTNGKEEGELVAHRYEEFFYQAAATGRVLFFANISDGDGWNDREMLDLGKSLPSFVRATMLFLADNRFSDSGLYAVLEQLLKLRYLKLLNLLGCRQITGLSFRALADCHMPSMQFLNLGRTAMDDDGLSALASHLACFPGLRVLCLSGCTAITSRGVLKLARHLPASLEELYLGQLGFDDEGLQGLLQWLPALRRLRRLDLHGCECISGIGLDALADCLPLLPPMLDLEGVAECPAGNKIVLAVLSKGQHFSCFRCGRTSSRSDGWQFCRCCKYIICKTCLHGVMWLPLQLRDTPEGQALSVAWSLGGRVREHLSWC